MDELTNSKVKDYGIEKQNDHKRQLIWSWKAIDNRYSALAISNTLKDITFGQLQLFYPIASADPIFQRLCDQSTYQKSNNCLVCKKQFGLMKGQKNCKFCGCAVCEECSPKKRSNPQNKSEFVRICDMCDEKYLEEFLSSVFKQQFQQLKEQNQRLEIETNSYKDCLNDQNNKHQIEQREYNIDKNELESQIAKEDSQLQKQKIKLENLKKDIIDVEQQIKLFKNQKAINEENVNDYISRIQLSKQQLKHQNTDIERISNKQKVTSDELATINQNVTSYQLNNRKGMDSILHTRIGKGKVIGGGKYAAKESNITNQGYDDVFRSQNNNIDSVENYLIGLPSNNSKISSFDINKF